MPRGGVRQGAGRKAGALTQKTRAVAEAIGVQGDTPLETLNELRLWAVGKFRELRADEASEFTTTMQAAEFAADIANKQAPFIHPKLSSVEAKVEGNVKATVRRIERVVVDSSDTDA